MENTNEQTPHQTIEITDLTVETAAANEVKGGKNSSAVVSLGKLGRVENQADQTPGTTLNHNETTVEDEEAETEPLADLTVSVTQEEEIAGGLGHVKVFDGRAYANNDAAAPGTTLNHNETTASDDAEESAPEALADLSVCEEQAEQAKGGWGNGKTYIDLNGNGLLLPAVQKVR